jgi:hypothetical protein
MKELADELTSFTYTAYSKLLKYLETKYNILPFNEVNCKDRPYLILRHDVDASPQLALDMARLEHKLGIKSTYFFLFSHRLYNLLDKNNYKIIVEISRLGHEIGLHYDLEVYESYENDSTECLEMEINILESLLKNDIKSISMHNPSLINKEDPFKVTEKYINAYNKQLYDLYVSDSCRSWYLGDLRKLLTLSYDKVQLVIHPILWSENKIPRYSVLENLFNTIYENNMKYRNEWIDIWKNHKKVITYEKEINPE